jgi:hypothetical protein
VKALMNWEGNARERSWPNLSVYPGISVDRPTKTTKNAQFGRSVSRPRFEQSTRVETLSVVALRQTILGSESFYFNDV